MPFQWNDQNIRLMLLYAITEADLQPSTTTWATVANKLNGPTASAVRYSKVFTLLPFFLPVHDFCCFDLIPPDSWHVRQLSAPANNHSSQKFYKLKKEAALLTGGGSDSPATPNSQATKATNGTKSTSTGRGRKRNADTDDTPTKKSKKTKTKAASVEPEYEDDDGGQNIKSDPESVMGGKIKVEQNGEGEEAVDGDNVFEDTT
jgi:hypothetical protein